MQPGPGTAGHFADISETNCECVGAESRVTAGVIARAAHEPSRSLKFYNHGEGPF